MVYPEVAQVFSTCRNPSRGKPTGKKTLTIIKEDDDFMLRHYRTNILTWKLDGSIIINTYVHSATTKSHINDYFPDGWYIFQKNFQWYIKSPYGVFDIVDKEFVIPGNDIYEYYLMA
jgi:hypothetical protein